MRVVARFAAALLLSVGVNLFAQGNAPPTRREGTDQKTSASRSRYTPAETRAVGQARVAREIAQYGRSTDAGRERDIAEIVALLTEAAAVPELVITPTIVNNPEINASALPGGYLVVNSGLLDIVEELARRDAPTDSLRRRRRAIAYTAAVLGHEIAHVTLGHTDEIMDRARRHGFRLDLRDTTVTTRAQAALTQALGDTAFLAAVQHMREAEVAADATGALYLLRAGWEIQDAMDLFRWFDAMERDGGSTAPRQLTWVRSHPRSSAREGALDAVRGRLKMRQSEFDDALTLVTHGVMLDTAIVMLDAVLADFPDLLAARHARAAAFHRKWLASVSVDRLRVRGSVPVYETRFISGIRGDLGDTAVLNRARRGYAAVLTQRPLPYTLSNLAVLDAYAGSMTSARQRGDSAAAMAPDDPEVLNNLGVVLFLGGRYRDAKDLFTRAASHIVDDNEVVVQAIRFNLGSAFAAVGDTGAAGQEMRRYLAMDSTSAWGQRAVSFLRGGSTASAGAPNANKGADQSPSLAGVRLGASKASVFAALGRPDDGADQKGAAVWRYRAKGLSFAINDATGVQLIWTTSPGEALDGVRVGDPMSTAQARWGVGRRFGDFVRFDRGGWVATIRVPQSTIREISAVPR